jgi:uncharacterized membrane protein YgcG
MDENGADLFATKVNWEIELEIDMAKLFAPVTMQSLVELLDEREFQRLKRLAEEEAKRQNQGGGNHNHDHGGGGSSGGFGMGGALGGLGSSMRSGGF